MADTLEQRLEILRRAFVMVHDQDGGVIRLTADVRFGFFQYAVLLEEALSALSAKDARIAELEALSEAALATYDELLAIVRGECPSLVNEDSGASAVLIKLMLRLADLRRARAARDA